MALTKLTADLNFNQAQPDKPPLTAAQMKVLLDSAGNTIKTYVNDTLTEELDGNIQDGMNRQAVIDGGFQVAQVNPVVGTVVNNPASNSYPVFDLWKVFQTPDGGTFPNVGHSQQHLYDTVQNVSKMYRITTNGAGTGFGTNSLYNTLQNIENGVRNLCGNGKKITVSFWARSTITNKKIGLNINQLYGTGGSPTATEVINGVNFTLTSSWQKFTHTFTTNTLSGKTFGTNGDDALQLTFSHAWGSNFQSRFGATSPETFVGAGGIEITAVQVNSGDVALEFQAEQFGDVLRKCQRYLKSLSGRYRMVSYNANLLAFGFESLKERMRASPTLVNLSAVELTDFGVYTLINVGQTGFVLTLPNPNYLIATKTTHGLTDAELLINSKLFADARF